MIAGLKPYPAMKDSHVPWLGKVPEDWDVLPNRALFVEVKEREHPDEQMLSVTITQGVIRQKTLLEDSSKKDSSNQDKSAYKLVYPDDIAYNKMRAWQGAIGVSDLRGIVSPAYVVIRLREDNDPRYFHHLFRTPQFVKEAERWSYGITSDMWSLRPEHFKMIYCSLPSKDEQTAIVRFLDHADLRIRRYIRTKQKLITLLEEQKQAIINRAVTRGLDPTVGLKPSGVEWLGDVPQHWEVRRLKSIARIRYGLGQPPRESEAGLPLIRATNVDHGRIVEKDLLRVDPENVPKTRGAFLSEGEIIVVRSGAYTADSAIIPKEYAGAVAGYDMVVTPRRARPEFIALALLSKYVRYDQLIIASMRSAQPHLNAEELGVAVVMIPPEGEQTQIVEHVKVATKEIEATIETAECEISLLHEYRTRLIADVVTGKLDVREAAAKVPEETDEPEPLDSAEALAEGEEEIEDTDLDAVPEEAEA